MLSPIIIKKSASTSKIFLQKEIDNVFIVTEGKRCMYIEL